MSGKGSLVGRALCEAVFSRTRKVRGLATRLMSWACGCEYGFITALLCWWKRAMTFLP